MADEDRSELVSQFMGVTGAEEERATFYLESSNWQLQVALASFFDEDEAPMEAATSPPVPVEPQVDASRPLLPAAGDPMVGGASGQNPTRKSSKQSSRFATIGDLRGERDDDDDGEEGQRFYAGGADHGSGQQVVGPRKKSSDNIVKDLFKSAREHGAEEVSSGAPASTSGQSSFVFRGAAYRLGESPSDSHQPVPGTAGTMPQKVKEVHIILKLWKNGFSVDDGPLRDFNSPENKEFLQSISKGEIPMELIRNAQGGEVNLDLQDHREEEYQKPKPQRKAFEGKGYKLGNLTPTLSGGQSTLSSTSAASTSAQAGAQAGPSSSWEVDNSQPTTTLQIRLANGLRLAGKFNLSHTIADIRRFIALSRPEYAAATYNLMTTFPNKVLSEDGQTISDAKLMNAVVVQRLT